QGHAALAVELRAAHLRASQAARDLDPHALGAGALRTLEALAHGATERDTGAELLRDALRDELGLGLGVLDLEDVELDLLAGELLEVGADALGLGAAPADHDARAGGVDVDADAVTRALDLDLRHTGAVELRLQHFAALDVLGHEVGVALTGLGGGRGPPRRVGGGGAQTEAVGVDLLAHYLPAFFAAVPSATSSSGVASTTVMWLVRLLMRNARPCARGWNRLSVVPSSTNARATTRSASSRNVFEASAFTRAFAIAAATSLYTGSLAPCGANFRIASASWACFPRMRSTTRRAF